MMVSVVVLLAVVVSLLTVLVIGLLRSYGEVLRRLHEAGLAPEGTAAAPNIGANIVANSGASSGSEAEAADIARRLDPAVAPPRQGQSVLPAIVDLAGVSPSGDAVAVGLRGGQRATMLAFLSSGCTTCAGFWEALRRGERLVLGGRDVRLVVVTGGPQHERPTAVAALAGPDLTVVMSDAAWTHYAVPATPYFVLIDAAHGILGEGSALGWAQLIGLMERAVSDRGFSLSAPSAPSGAVPAGHPSGPIDLRSTERGPLREARTDEVLRKAGILPGDVRLYESPLSDHDNHDRHDHRGSR